MKPATVQKNTSRFPIILSIVSVAFLAFAAFQLGALSQGGTSVSPKKSDSPRPESLTIHDDEPSSLAAWPPETHINPVTNTRSLENTGGDHERSDGDTLHRLTLKAALEEIGRATSLQIVIAAELEQSPVTLPAAEGTVDQRLRALLRPFDFFVAYRAENGTAPSAVWVYPKGQSAGIDADQLQTSALLANAVAGTASDDPKVRARAYELMIDYGATDAREQLLTALRDPAEDVRFHALDMALRRGMALDPGLLQHLLQSDPSPLIRSLSLNGLVGDPQITATQRQTLASIAAADADAHMRAQSEELLAYLANSAPNVDDAQAQETATAE